MAQSTNLTPLRPLELQRSRRDALIASVVVGFFAGVLSVFAIVIGVVLCLIVIGTIVGLPFSLLGLLSLHGLVGGIVGRSGGVFFALLLGAGCGFAAYRSRRRRVERAPLR